MCLWVGGDLAVWVRARAEKMLFARDDAYGESMSMSIKYCCAHVLIVGKRACSGSGNGVLIAGEADKGDHQCTVFEYGHTR